MEIVAPAFEVPRSDVFGCGFVDVHDRRRGIGHGDRGRLREAQQLDTEVGREGQHRDGQQGEDDQARREGQALARRGDRPRDRDDGLGLARIPALATPLEQDIVRVQAEVQRVIAQESLGVDRSRELAVVTALEGSEVADPDLGVALSAVEVDALALSCGEQAFGQARSGLGRDPGARPPRSALTARRTWSRVVIAPCPHRARSCPGRPGPAPPQRPPRPKDTPASSQTMRRPAGSSAQTPGSSMSSWVLSQLSGP